MYDLGANIGWYSLLAARVVGPRGSVLAFEPSLENALLAQQNATVNGLDNITVVAAALTDRDGWVAFLQRGSLEGRLEKDDSDAQAERRARQRIRFEGRTLVPITSLDSWLAQTGEPPPSVVKIDVEGAEVGVRARPQRVRAPGDRARRPHTRGAVVGAHPRAALWPLAQTGRNRRARSRRRRGSSTVGRSRGCARREDRKSLPRR